MKRLTVNIYALHYVLYLCTLNKSKLARAVSLTHPNRGYQLQGLNIATAYSIYIYEL